MSEVAHGCYRYWRDGVLQDITEPWRLMRTAQGRRLEGQRMQGGKILFTVEAESSGGRWQDLRLHWHREPARSIHWTAQDIPTGSLLFPVLRAAMGPLVRQLCGGPRTVAVPDLHDPADAARFLQPRLSQRHALRLGDGRYRYCGGEYGDAGCDCWLGENGLLLRYRWRSAQGEWDVRLESE